MYTANNATSRQHRHKSQSTECVGTATSKPAQNVDKHSATTTIHKENK